MKNREKYKNELMDVIKMDGRICGFVKKHEVFRMIGTGWESFCEMDSERRKRRVVTAVFLRMERVHEHGS